MKESITIRFEMGDNGKQTVHIDYHPATIESGLRDAMLAKETALHTLAADAIVHRQQVGLPIPTVLIDVLNARTFNELR